MRYANAAGNGPLSPPARSRSFRVNHFRGIEFRQKANPPIDLAKPPLAVPIVSVFTTITVARSPYHHSVTPDVLW